MASTADGDGRRVPVGEVLMAFARTLTRLHPDDLPALIERSCRSLGGSGVVVLLADVDQRTLHAIAGASSPSLAVDGTVAGRAYRREEPLVLSEGDHETIPEPDGEGHSPSEDRLRLGSAGKGRVRLWLPLLDSAERIGVLGVVVEGPDVDLPVWEAMASMAAEAITTKSAYGDHLTLTRRSQAMTLAAEMRFAMLPPLAFSSPHVEVAGILEPAYEIAGDTFDYSIDGSSLSIAVLDAMGHGLHASRMANLAVSAYRSARRQHRSHHEMLRLIDEFIQDQFGEQHYVTGQIASFDTTTGVLQIVNAGHPRPLHFRRGMEIGEVPCKPCLPLGLGSVDATESVTSLERGDAVLFYTDGVVEARSPAREELGRDRLADLTSRSLRAGERPAEVVRQVVLAAHDHAESSLHDDATLVLLTWPET